MVISLRRCRKPALIVLAIIIMVSAIIGIFRNRWENESRQAAGEYNEMVVEAFLVALGSFTNGNEGMELFDISKGEVIQKYKVSKEIHDRVVSYLDNITGMYTKVNAFPDSGHILRIKLDPGADIVNKWPNSYGLFIIENVFIIYPEGRSPYILLLDSSSRPLFFNFEADNKFELLDMLLERSKT